MISPQAFIAPGAQIGARVTIYPFAYIEDDVVIGDDCTIYPHVSLINGTRIGSGNTIYQNAVLGASPQDTVLSAVVPYGCGKQGRADSNGGMPLPQCESLNLKEKVV